MPWTVATRCHLATLAALVLCVALTACGAPATANVPSPTATPTATPPSSNLPSTLQIVRFSNFPQYRVAPFTADTTDEAKVRKLYAAALALPPTAHGRWCPIDIGVYYELTFERQGAIVLQAILSGGCPTLRVSNPAGCRDASGPFQQELADTLGVPLFDLTFDGAGTAGPSGPLAPTVPTPPLLVPGSCSETSAGG